MDRPLSFADRCIFTLYFLYRAITGMAKVLRHFWAKDVRIGDTYVADLKIAATFERKEDFSA